MDRLVESIRHFAGFGIERLDSLLPLSATQLLWTVGTAAILLPAAAYALWFQNPTVLSESVESQSTQTKTQLIDKPAPVRLDSALNADTENVSTPPDDTSSSQSLGNNVNANVQINGQDVPLPPDGTIHKEIHNENGNTSVDISVQSSSSGTSHSRSSTNIEVNSRSRSEGTHVE